jgi:hypothetical protein
MSDQGEKYVFDWLKLPQDSFLKWFFLTVVPSQDAEWFERIRQASAGFREVELDIRINGESVPVEHFIDVLQQTLENQAQNAAEEMIETGLPGVREMLEAAEEAIRETIKDKLRAAGITLPNYEEGRW